VEKALVFRPDFKDGHSSKGEPCKSFCPLGFIIFPNNNIPIRLITK
jgi:hypothetical protein